MISDERLAFSRGSILPVGSAMTIRVGSPFNEKINIGTKPKHAARNGSSSVPIRNDHFNTTFLYSCFTTAKNFFINYPWLSWFPRILSMKMSLRLASTSSNFEISAPPSISLLSRS